VDFDFNKGVERLCAKFGALYICDEVVSGFRIGMAGAQGYYGVTPDLTIFGKVIAGGYPGAGGVGGKKEYMRYLGAGLDGGTKIHKALIGGTMAATPVSCAAGYYTLEEIDRTNACQKAGEMGDLLTAGLQALVKKYNLPVVVFNQGSVCHLDSTGTMHFAIDWSKPWQIPAVLKATDLRKKEMEHMGAAYMGEGLVTLAGSRLYTSAAYTPELITEALARFERVFRNCGVIATGA
jgi:glutamate-1-semialdehyde 2,1-aminomutase